MAERLTYTAEGWGVGEVWIEGGRLLWHELPRPASAKPNGVHPLAKRFEAFLVGARDDFLDVQVDLDGATVFQAAVTKALRSVPYGDTISYAELAALAGHPRAQRAVGTFCARNRFGLVVPCHRVVGSDGIGSYGSLGVTYKRRLLELERAVI